MECRALLVAPLVLVGHSRRIAAKWIASTPLTFASRRTVGVRHPNLENPIKIHLFAVFYPGEQLNGVVLIESIAPIKLRGAF